MTNRIQELADKAKESVPKGILSVDEWINQYNILFANLIVQECIDCCGSQADRKNIRKNFGFHIESDVKYSGIDPHNSITSQYDRPYNLPRGITNEKS